MLTIFFLGLGLTMGTGPSKIPSDTPLGCLLANLKPIWLSPDLKAKKTSFSLQSGLATIPIGQ
jgi:hypothetical protein